jgi:hypothetical protein
MNDSFALKLLYSEKIFAISTGLRNGLDMVLLPGIQPEPSSTYLIELILKWLKMNNGCS